jgi:hypothetical protein
LNLARHSYDSLNVHHCCPVSLMKRRSAVYLQVANTHGGLLALNRVGACSDQLWRGRNRHLANLLKIN